MNFKKKQSGFYCLLTLGYFIVNIWRADLKAWCGGSGMNIVLWGKRHILTLALSLCGPEKVILRTPVSSFILMEMQTWRTGDRRPGHWTSGPQGMMNTNKKRTDSSLRLWEWAGPTHSLVLGPVMPTLHLCPSELWESKSLGGGCFASFSSVVLSHPVHRNVLREPQEVNPLPQSVWWLIPSNPGLSVKDRTSLLHFAGGVEGLGFPETSRGFPLCCWREGNSSTGHGYFHSMFSSLWWKSSHVTFYWAVNFFQIFETLFLTLGHFFSHYMFPFSFFFFFQLR